MLLAAAGGFGMSSIIFFVLIIGMMYFMMIRPQKKQQQQRQEMMNQLHIGDQVVTIGRLHGKVYEIDDEAKTITLDCEGIYLTFDRIAIMRVEKGSQAAPVQETSTTVESEDTSKEEASSEITEETTKED